MGNVDVALQTVPTFQQRSCACLDLNIWLQIILSYRKIEHVTIISNKFFQVPFATASLSLFWSCHYCESCG